MKTPQPRTGSLHGKTIGGAVWLDRKTWLEPEEFTYPSGGFLRRAYVELRRNEHNPIVLPYGENKIVWASIPDTAFSIPARLIIRGKRIRGFISSDDNVFTFTPEADPKHCRNCQAGDGCKK